VAFAMVFPFLRMPNLKEIFSDAYNNSGSCNAARRMLAYGVMTNLFNELKAFPLDNMNVSNFGAYAAMCKRQTEVAISQLDVFLPASYENIMALVLGAAQAIEECKPSLCWVMVSAAAGLCQNLGYHRINTMINDTPEERNNKIHIFWMIYMFDKTLSLRLGRASIIQDWDISLPFILPGDYDKDVRDGVTMLSYWIKVAQIQGRTYEQLFSPAAFLKSSEERTQSAVELVKAMNQTWYERADATVTDFANITTNTGFVSQQRARVSHSPADTPLPSQHRRYIHEALGGDPARNAQVQGKLNDIRPLVWF
jgi:hypothetical protein